MSYKFSSLNNGVNNHLNYHPPQQSLFINGNGGSTIQNQNGQMLSSSNQIKPVNMSDYKKIYVGKFPPYVSDIFMKKLLEVS